MTAKHTVKLTGNFERNLESIEAFLVEAGVSHAYDALLNELIETVVPNLESFPAMGHLFLERSARSIEVTNGLARLKKQLWTFAEDVELREYMMTHYLLLYARIKGSVYLLSIRHQKQLSFDLQGLWSTRN